MYQQILLEINKGPNTLIKLPPITPQTIKTPCKTVHFTFSVEHMLFILYGDICIYEFQFMLLFLFQLLGDDGSTPLVELGVDNEGVMNEWLMTICQVVADTVSAHTD